MVGERDAVTVSVQHVVSNQSSITNICEWVEALSVPIPV